jgi:hypothetical protein
MNIPTIKDVQLVEADPFGSEMLKLLRADLEVARWARWSVCYFTEAGLEPLKAGLIRVLSHPLTRGLFTLTCICDEPALIKISREAQIPLGRLRVFLPIGLPTHSQDVRLIHSKMVLIIRPADPKDSTKGEIAVLYVGSHNWTGAAFRQNSLNGNNVETSVRIVATWNQKTEEKLIAAAESDDYQPCNVILDAVSQMAASFVLWSNTDLAVSKAAAELASWRRACCPGEVPSPGYTPLLVLTAVLDPGSITLEQQTSIAQNLRMTKPEIPQVGELIYVQHHRMNSEPNTFDTGVAWAILLWETRADLQKRRTPWLILGTPMNLGMQNAGAPELREFQWVAGDPNLNQTDVGRRRARKPQTITVEVGGNDPLDVEWWSIDKVPKDTSSHVVERRQSDRHILVRVQVVRSPHNEGPKEDFEWRGSELPFHEGRNRTRRRYFLVHNDYNKPDESRANEMIQEQLDEFGMPGATIERPTPTGAPSLAEVDVYEVEALINELLFDRNDAGKVFAQHVVSDRTLGFSIGNTADNAKRIVPRMEKLVAPSAPYVCQALGINDEEGKALHFKPDDR